MLAVAALLAATAVLFALRPDLDLAAARAFFEDGKFIGVTPRGETARHIGYVLPFWILGAAAALWLLRLIGVRRWPLPSFRAVLFLAATMAVGPGLLVNVALKDNSHRPRPVQTQELGGPWEFRPWHRFDGQCQRNCSFVSGEASSAFWTLAPALLTPPPVRPAAVAAALVFGTSVALLRMAFGGHYLSDSIMSALLTLLVVLGAHRLFFGPSGSLTKPARKKPAASGLRDADAPL